MTSVDFRFASRVASMKPSPIREILRVAERPDVISFAGGLPAGELFPIEAIADAHARVLADEGAASLQYSTTEGFAPLREWVVAHLARRGIRCDADQVLITAGSQQGIDLVAKLLVDPGDTVLVESPCYLAALQSFASYEATFTVVDSDDDGMRVEELESSIGARRPKLIYVVSDFQNPKGTTLSRERRELLLRVAREHGIPILEDDPYGELRFAGEPVPPLAALDEGGGVVYLGTFSKTLAPGLRVAWAVGPKPLIRRMAIAKQAVDLHTGTLAQRAVARLLQTFDYAQHMDTLRRVYRQRCEAMLGALERHFPRGTRWTRPEGGLFVWTQLPRAISADALFDDVIREGVAFVPGTAFFADRPRHEFMRLNFSNRDPAAIEAGMRVIAQAVERRLESGPRAEVGS